MRQDVDVGEQIDIEAVFKIRTDIMCVGGGPFAMYGGSFRTAALGTKLQHLGIADGVQAMDEIDQQDIGRVVGGCLVRAR